MGQEPSGQVGGCCMVCVAAGALVMLRSLLEGVLVSFSGCARCPLSPVGTAALFAQSAGSLWWGGIQRHVVLCGSRLRGCGGIDWVWCGRSVLWSSLSGCRVVRDVLRPLPLRGARAVSSTLVGVGL